MKFNFDLKFSKADWIKIGYKLFFGLMGIGLIIGFWISGLLDLHVHQKSGGKYDPTYWNYFALNGNTYSVQFFSYFTIQSNFLCAIVLIYSAIYHRRENKKKFLRHGFVQAIAIYITITGIIFNGLLLPNTLASGDKISSTEWFELMWQHTVMPIAFVIYFLFLFNNRTERTEYKYAMQRYVWRYTIYLLVYMFYILIKGYLIKYTTTSTPHFSYPGLFQYFFLNFSQTTFGLPGVAWFFIAFVLILGIEVGFIAAYTGITNYRVRYNNKKITKNKPVLKKVN